MPRRRSAISPPRSRPSSSPSPSCSTSGSGRPPSGRGCSTSWSCSSANLWSMSRKLRRRTRSQPDSTQAAAHATPLRRQPARRPIPADLPRFRRVEPSPTACPCCGGALRKLGEDITETLERVPAQWKVVQTVREKWTCRQCETITQPTARSHPIARGRAGPQLLADVLFGKYGAHLPLNRQSEIYAREGIALDVSTLADWVGACAATLMPLRDASERHVHAAERLHVDDTTVPVLAKNKCRTG